MTAISLLDFAHVTRGATLAQAFANTVDAARHAEQLGYSRFWLAEHHNMPGIASAATAVMIGHVASATSRIRVGAGGIMLPNHAPMIVAEQFGTLEALYPGRIDLGLGRAPGTDQMTLRALRRHPAAAEHFPQDVVELQALLGDLQPGQRLRAVPGLGSHVPLWILGSSTFGADLAAALGLPYGFASHFAPDELDRALHVYRSRFQPSSQCDRPYAMVGVNVVAAETDAEALRLFTSVQQQFANLFRGEPGTLQPPIDDFQAYASPMERAQAMHMLACSVVGGRETVRAGLEQLIRRTRADELMIVTTVFDHDARLRSLALVADIMQESAPDDG